MEFLDKNEIGLLYAFETAVFTRLRYQNRILKPPPQSRRTAVHMLLPWTNSVRSAQDNATTTIPTPEEVDFVALPREHDLVVASQIFSMSPDLQQPSSSPISSSLTGSVSSTCCRCKDVVVFYFQALMFIEIGKEKVSWKGTREKKSIGKDLSTSLYALSYLF